MKNKFLTSGSIIAAVFASLCCIGPLVLVGFGIGSVAFFSRFDAFRPYLILASVLLLVPASYLAYRKREVKCEDGSCKIESAGKWNKISVWFAILIVAGFIAVPYLGFAKSGQNQLTDSHKFQTVKLKINNMDCEASALGLQSQLKKEKGVKAASILYKGRKGIVEYDSKKITSQNIVNILKDEGYPSKIIK
jgi:mercuric ion transport protein